MKSKELARATISFALGLLSLGFGRPVRADQAAELGAAGVPSRSVIEITVIGAPAVLDRVQRAILPRGLGASTLRWSWSARWDPAQLMNRDAAANDVLVRGWLDLSQPARAHVYFADLRAERFVIRDLELTGELAEIDLEALSQTLELSIRALLEDRLAGLDREQARSLLARSAPQPQPSQAKLAPARASVERGSQAGLSISASWSVERYARELAVVHGPGLSLAYELPDQDWRAAVWVSGQYQLEASERGARAGLLLQTLALRVGMDLVRPALARRWFVGARLGLGIDQAHFTPRLGSDGSPSTLTAPRSDTVPMLLGAALFGAELGARLRLSVALFADLALLRLKYDVDVAGRAETIVEPFWVRPGVSLALTAR